MCRTSLNTSFPSEHCCILHTLSQTTCMSWPWRPCRCWDNQDEIKVSIGNVGKIAKSCRHPWLEANTDFFKYFVIILIMTRFSAFKRWADNTVAKGVAARAKLGALSSLSNAHFDISKFKQYLYTYSCMYQYEAGVGGGGVREKSWRLRGWKAFHFSEDLFSMGTKIWMNSFPTPSTPL